MLSLIRVTFRKNHSMEELQRGRKVHHKNKSVHNKNCVQNGKTNFIKGFIKERVKLRMMEALVHQNYFVFFECTRATLFNVNLYG